MTQHLFLGINTLFFYQLSSALITDVNQSDQWNPLVLLHSIFKLEILH